MAFLRKSRPLTIAVAALYLVALLPHAPSAQQPTEYELKAVFLFNFSQFVAWPPAAFDDTATPFVIGVLGSDPFGSALDEVVRGESINGRPFAVMRFRRVEDVGRCHILFIDRSEHERADVIFERLRGRPILTVGDFEGFAHRGGVIRFISVGNKVKFRINLDAAQAAGLTISSKLLRPAEIVASPSD